MKVRNGGPWDYKKGQPQYESFGNFHYGAVGTAAGIPEAVLLRAAGAAQIKAGTSEENFGYFGPMRLMGMIRLTKCGLRRA